MLVNSQITISSLSQQLDRIRNYHGHRKRVEHTYRESGLTAMKKSMSYDRQKTRMYEYIKGRKIYTNFHNKKEQLRQNQQKDAKMLQNILEYDHKQFMFSLNSNRNTKSTLHHNAMVSQWQKSRVIGQQNQKIHLRISKAKSLYSHLFASRYPWQKIHTETAYGDMKGQLKDSDSQIEYSIENEEETPEDKSYFDSGNKFNINHPTYTPLLTSGVRLKRPQTLETSTSPLINRSLTTRKICQRARRQKLAQHLFDRKRQWQRGIKSKLQIKRT